MRKHQLNCFLIFLTVVCISCHNTDRQKELTCPEFEFADSRLDSIATQFFNNVEEGRMAVVVLHRISHATTRIKFTQVIVSTFLHDNLSQYNVFCFHGQRFILLNGIENIMKGDGISKQFLPQTEPDDEYVWDPPTESYKLEEGVLTREPFDDWINLEGPMDTLRIVPEEKQRISKPLKSEMPDGTKGH